MLPCLALPWLQALALSQIPLQVCQLDGLILTPAVADALASLTTVTRLVTFNCTISTRDDAAETARGLNAAGLQGVGEDEDGGDVEVEVEVEVGDQEMPGDDEIVAQVQQALNAIVQQHQQGQGQAGEEEEEEEAQAQEQGQGQEQAQVAAGGLQDMQVELPPEMPAEHQLPGLLHAHHHAAHQPPHPPAAALEPLGEPHGVPGGAGTEEAAATEEGGNGNGGGSLGQFAVQGGAQLASPLPLPLPEAELPPPGHFAFLSCLSSLTRLTKLCLDFAEFNKPVVMGPR